MEGGEGAPGGREGSSEPVVVVEVEVLEGGEGAPGGREDSSEPIVEEADVLEGSEGAPGGRENSSELVVAKVKVMEGFIASIQLKYGISRDGHGRTVLMAESEFEHYDVSIIST